MSSTTSIFNRLPDPVPALKARLAALIVDEMHGWRADYAGDFLATDYSGMSKLRNGDLRRFSLQKLVRMAANIGIEVTLSTSIAPVAPGSPRAARSPWRPPRSRS